MDSKEKRVFGGGGGAAAAGEDIDEAEDVEETTVFLDNRDLEHKRLEVSAPASPAKRANSQKEVQQGASEKDVSFDGRWVCFWLRMMIYHQVTDSR